MEFSEILFLVDARFFYLIVVAEDAHAHRHHDADRGRPAVSRVFTRNKTGGEGRCTGAIYGV